MPRINVTLSESQKDNWDAYVEENPGVDSLSDLVRTAVTEYMADETSSGGELNDAVVHEPGASPGQVSRRLRPEQ